MAKKVDKKANKPAEIPTTGTPSSGIPISGSPSSGMAVSGSQSSPMGNNMTADQMTMAQIEQSIKDSSDPENRLKRLRNPVNVRSCLLNILILLVMTFTIVVIWCAIAVDKFSFGTVMADMSEQFGITQGFKWLGSQIASWFS